MPGPAPSAYNLRGSSSVALTPSQPKKADVRQGIPAKGHGHRPVAVAGEPYRCENIHPGAGEEGIEGHKKSGCFVTANADLSVIAPSRRPSNHRTNQPLQVPNVRFVGRRDTGVR